jgi:hypothetical protein
MEMLTLIPIKSVQSSVVKEKVEEKKSIANYGMMPGCPECGGNLILKEGCMACSNCGFSRCG